MCAVIDRVNKKVQRLFDYLKLMHGDDASNILVNDKYWSELPEHSSIVIQFWDYIKAEFNTHDMLEALLHQSKITIDPEESINNLFFEYTGILLKDAVINSNKSQFADSGAH